ncbi:hypothetical protein EC988_006431 [Linderina pennispora]|nr:hypothetical protein EC988_006431 [Linderina pennispora]
MASSSPEPLSIPCRVSLDSPPPPRSRRRFSRVISSSPEPPGSPENPPSAALSESSGRQLVKYMEPWWQKNIGWADEPEERWISTLQRLVDLSYTQAHLHALDVPDLPVDAFCRFGMHFYMFLLDASEKHSDAYDIPDDLIDACMVLRNVLETDLDGAFMAGRAWETFCDLNIALWMCWFCPKTTDGVLANVVVGYLYKALQTGMKLETCVMWIATWARIAVFLVYRERPVECCEREKEMIMALFQFYVRECMPTPYGALFQAYEQNLKK